MALRWNCIIAFLFLVAPAWAVGGSTPPVDPPPPPLTQAAQPDVADMNAMCPVLTDEPSDPEIYVDYNGRRVYFCCVRCRRKFQQEPEKYVANLAAFSQPTDDQLQTAEETAGDQSGGRSDVAVQPAAAPPAPEKNDVHEHEPAAGEADAHDHDREHDHDADEQTAGIALPKFLRWLGKFHPASVNFPVGLLVAGALAELLVMITKRPSLAVAARYCLWIGALGAISAATLGWFFGGIHLIDNRWMLTTHRWLGSVTALTAIIALVASETHHRRPTSHAAGQWYRTALFFAAALVTATGFFGGALVYGIDHYYW